MTLRISKEEFESKLEKTFRKEGIIDVLYESYSDLALRADSTSAPQTTQEKGLEKAISTILDGYVTNTLENLSLNGAKIASRLIMGDAYDERENPHSKEPLSYLTADTYSHDRVLVIDKTYQNNIPLLENALRTVKHTGEITQKEEFLVRTANLYNRPELSRLNAHDPSLAYKTGQTISQIVINASNEKELDLALDTAKNLLSLTSRSQKNYSQFEKKLKQVNEFYLNDDLKGANDYVRTELKKLN